jgi:hypothetical protein
MRSNVCMFPRRSLTNEDGLRDIEEEDEEGEKEEDEEEEKEEEEEE